LCRAKAHFNSVNTLQRACEAAARHGQIPVLQWLTTLLHTLDDTRNNSSISINGTNNSTSNQQLQQAAAAAAAAVPLSTVAAGTIASSSTSSSDTPHSPGSRAPPAPGTAEAFTENRLADTDNSSSDSSGTGSVAFVAATAAVRTAMMDKAAASGQLSTLQWIAANMRYSATIGVYSIVYSASLLTTMLKQHVSLYSYNKATAIISRNTN
jgi:hypothetical protein